MSWNCKSLNNKKVELTKFIEQHDIKIIMLSETWLNPNKNFHIPNFECHRVDRYRGGVAILVESSIRHSVIKTIKSDHSEAIVIKIANHNKQEIKLASIYCSPAAKTEESNDFFNKLTSIPGTVIASGDFNSKHKSWNNSKNCNRGVNLLRLCNQKNFTIHAPDSPTLLPSRGDFSVVDFVISKSFSNISPIEVVNDLSSDHFPITFNVDFDIPKDKRKKIFNLSKANWKKFRENLNQTAIKTDEKYLTFSSTTEIDNCIDEITDSIINAANESIPKRDQYSRRYPFNQTIHNLTKERNRYRNLFTKTRNPLYRSLTSRAQQLIKFHTNEMCEMEINQKIESLNIKDLSLYQFARNLKRKQSYIPPLKSQIDDLAFSNEQKSDLLANSFEKSHLLTKNCTSKHESVVKRSINKLGRDKSATPASEFFQLPELQSIIRYLKTRKAPGDDGILNIFIKNLPTNINKILIKIFNGCLIKSYFPLKWKLASIFPIQKPGKDHTTPAGYRPISLLSNLGKLYEKLLLTRLMKIIKEKNIIKNHQFGFRAQHSTTQQLVRLSKFISLGFNHNQSTGVISLDIEKAFDTTWHDGLVHKLMKMDFPIFLIKIISSYLKDRKAFVKLSDKKSSTFDVLAGVPQGSLLAPILFILFINDLPTPKDCEIGTYADDTVFFTKASWKNAKTIKKRLENGFIKIEQFYDSWKIKINKEKTESIMFTHSRKMIEKKNQFKIKIDNSEIPWKETIRYLGVHLDPKLNFKSHIDITLRKANGMISTLFSIFKKESSLSSNLKLLIYKLYIRPIFTYSAPTIVNAPTTHLKKLQTMQNKCLRMVYNLPRYTWIKELHDISKIPTIEEFFQKLTESFYSRSNEVANDFVNSLGIYDLPRSFRIKHRLPVKHPQRGGSPF